MMRYFYCFLLCMVACCWGNAAEVTDSLWIRLQVVNGETEYHVDNARISVRNISGDMICDSMPNYKLGESRRVYPIVIYRAHIPSQPEYDLRISAPEFEIYEQRVSVANLSKVGRYYQIEDPIELTPLREGKKLKEVTVTATKVKMVMKGDTIEYDAAAFNLPHGSMLDDLIRELPGATLNSKGRITVNGRFVSELLVNGREFFKGDPMVALRNLPHYTVKNIQVYRRAPRDVTPEEAVGRDKSNDPLVLDVNLKREYQGGWISNYELGGGSSLNRLDARWLGRVFAMHFTKKNYIAIFANANNLNNASEAGSKGEWTKPDEKSGETKIYKAGVEFNTDWNDQDRYGVNIKINGQREQSYNTSETFSEKYLSGGNVLNRSRSGRSDCASLLNGTFEISRRFNPLRVHLRVVADYGHNLKKDTIGSNDSNLSATEPSGSELIYDRLQRTRIKNNNYMVRGCLIFRPIYGKLPNWTSNVGLQFDGGYDKSWLNQDNYDMITYPSAPENNIFRLQRIDQPDSHSTIGVLAMFGVQDIQIASVKFRGGINYSYDFDKYDGTRQLKEAGVDGEAMAPSVVENYIIDPVNSYVQTLYIHNHSIRPRIGFSKGFLQLDISGAMEIPVRKLNDLREVREQRVSRNDVLFKPYISFSYRNRQASRSISMSIIQTAPNMDYLLDIRDTSNPMATYLGNRNLRKSTRYFINGQIQNAWSTHQRMYNFSVHASKQDNQIAMSRIYNRETGMTVYRPVNISGSWRLSSTLNYSRTLDRQDRLYVSNSLHLGFNHSVDLSSASETISKSAVNDGTIRNNFKLNYNIAGIKLSSKVDIDWHRLHSLNHLFSDFSYLDVNYGIGIKYTLPGAIDLDTDLMAYCRRGYADPTMNTTDWVWNLQLSKTFGRTKQFTVKAIGFDLLQQLPTVKQVVNAQGRTESRYNSQPAYALLTLTYRLDIKPQKK